MSVGLRRFLKSSSNQIVMKILTQFTVCLLVLIFGQSYGFSLNMDYDKYEDLRSTPKYRDVAGKVFELKCDFWVFGYVDWDEKRLTVERLHNHTMTAYDGPAIGGSSLRYFGRLPKGTQVQVNRIIELTSSNPAYWVEVLNPPDERYSGLQIKIQQGSHVKNYSRKSYPSGGKRLNEAFFEDISED